MTILRALWTLIGYRHRALTTIPDGDVRLLQKKEAEEVARKAAKAEVWLRGYVL